MFKFLKHWLAARSLAKKQQTAAAELQDIFNTRAALLEREAYLMRFAGRLAVREVEQNIAARRTSRQQVGA